MADIERQQIDEQRQRMVARQIRDRGIGSPALLAAFEAVPRHAFVPSHLADDAYGDEPLPIGEGQTISQPYIVARMIEAARIGPHDRVLEVGAGSGYAAAILSRIAKAVFAVERHHTLADQAAERIAALGYDNCTIVAGDGMEGLPQAAPFDAILVAAQGTQVPRALCEQLAIGGRLVMPVGDERMQQLTRIVRTGEDSWESEEITPVRFVPLLKGEVEGHEAKGDDAASSGERSLPRLIGERAHALPPVDDPEFAAAFDRFGGRRIVMLGEASHGTHEFYAARAAITRRLVERHGFNIVAIEGDWPDAAVLDSYIRGLPQRDQSFVPFTRFPEWMWRNTVIPGLLRDLRSINQARPKDDRIGFYGLDIYNMNASIEAVLGYLDAHDRDAAKVARERYGCLAPWQEDPALYGRATLRASYDACEGPVVRQCRELLEQALEGEGRSFDAAMNARLVASAERYYRIMYHGGAESWNLRDRHMFETLEHLLDARGSDAKAVVWAHNSHIGDARATDMGKRRGEHNIGQLAREAWGDDVALIGFGTHAGTVSAASDWDAERQTMDVRPSLPGSFERLCHESGETRFLLETNGDDELSRRLGEPLLERFIGVIYRPETERGSHYTHAVPREQFDAWCWFDRTTALEPLPGGPAQDDGQRDTFPFGL